jgi:hypothetical protein
MVWRRPRGDGALLHLNAAEEGGMAMVDLETVPL